MRIAIPVAVLLAGGLVLGLFLDRLADEGHPRSSAPAYSWDEIEATRQKSQELDEVREGLHHFQKELTRLKGAVLEGSLSLPDAADQVIEVARQHNPSYLKALGSVRPEPTERERVIRCLLCHFETAERVGMLTPAQREQFHRLRKEYGPGLENH
jgi:hypothetical protein